MLLVEKRPVRDKVASGLARVEIMSGGMARFVLYIENRLPDGSVEYELVEKIVLPLEAVPDGIMLASEACAMVLVGTVKRFLLPHQLH